MKTIVFALAAIRFTAIVNAAETPAAVEKVAAAVAPVPSAEKVLADAGTKAAAENKTIFLHFGASWCIWCKRLDAFTSRPDIQPIFDKYFVPVTLTVQEHDAAHKALENPGGADKLNALGGGGGGIPFYAFLDAKGANIVTSAMTTPAKPQGANIGYPGAPAEITWFMGMLKKAAPKMTEEELNTIETVLRTTKPS